VTAQATAAAKILRFIEIPSEEVGPVRKDHRRDRFWRAPHASGPVSSGH